MLEIKKAGKPAISLIRDLACSIWPIAYKDMITPGQLKYMLELIYSDEALGKQLSELKHRFIIVYENNIAIGFASFSNKYPYEQTVYRLYKLYVLIDHQKKGIGRFLLNYIINEIKPAGAKILELNVNRNNPALHFYNHFGFTIAKEEDIDIGEGYYMNDYVMELKL